MKLRSIISCILVLALMFTTFAFAIPASAAEVLIGIILFFMLGCEFFINYRLIVRGKEEKNA